MILSVAANVTRGEDENTNTNTNRRYPRKQLTQHGGHNMEGAQQRLLGEQDRPGDTCWTGSPRMWGRTGGGTGGRTGGIAARVGGAVE